MPLLEPHGHHPGTTPDGATTPNPRHDADAPLLELQDLAVGYRPHHPVVAGVNLALRPGETLGLLGASGSGKSTIGHAVVGLVRPTGGRILFRGEDITHAGPRRRRALSRHLQIVFQDPHGSLNPSRTIGSTLAEPLRVVHRLPRRAAGRKVAEALTRVGLSPAVAARYPGSFSGGQLQRIAIARALVPEPDLVVCDEPTSALDLSVQAQILNLLLDLQQQLGLGYLFISHDADVVRFFCHRTVLLRDGHLTEPTPTQR